MVIKVIYQALHFILEKKNNKRLLMDYKFAMVWLGYWESTKYTTHLISML